MKGLFTFWLLAAVLPASSAFAGDAGGAAGYVFTDVRVNPCTPVKDQHRSGTCWAFGGVSFLESDLIRRGKGAHDLSEMWAVRHAWKAKMENYVRMHGRAAISSGGNVHDVFDMISQYGMVPETVYPGLGYGTRRHVHKELDRVLYAFADELLSAPNGALTPSWSKALDGILDAYLGPVPDTFAYGGKTYTPQSFADELGFDPDDYATLTSYTHRPFYTAFPLEIPDNWARGYAYNLPLDEMMGYVDGALEAGYTVAWDADISEPSCSLTLGIALLPEEERETPQGLSAEERDSGLRAKAYPVRERTVDQALRQRMFDDYRTVDDHVMEIVGLARDREGRKFYKVKNSHGVHNPYGGYVYVSEPYVRAKTLTVTLRREAFPQGRALPPNPSGKEGKGEKGPDLIRP